MSVETRIRYRIKKTDDGYLPQWYAGWFRWKPFKLWYADVEMGGFTMYSEWGRDPVFETEADAESFIKKAIAQGTKGEYHQKFDECLSGLIRY